MSTLIYEEKMRELIDLMPLFTNPNGSFKIQYDHGTKDVLNKYLVMKKSESIYPLIWLIPQKNPLDTLRNTITNSSRFIISMKSEHVDEFNGFQFNTDLKNVLLPVFDNFKLLLEKSGITTIQNNTLTYEFKPNFSMEDDGKGLITIWNALVVDVTVRMDGNKCISKNIKFKPWPTLINP